MSDPATDPTINPDNTGDQLHEEAPPVDDPSTGSADTAPAVEGSDVDDDDETVNDG